MALRRYFPFDGETLRTVWFDVSGGGTVSLAAGRNGGYGFNPSTTNVASLGANCPRVFVGFAVRNAAIDTGDGSIVYQFRDNGGDQCALHISQSGEFRLKRAGTLLAGPSAVGSWPASASSGHVFLEADITFHNTAGAVQVWVAGTSVLTASGIDTQGTANAHANQLVISADFDYDDGWVCDDTGSAPDNTRLGDFRWDLDPVTSDDAVQFTPLSGASNAAMVDDSPTHDSDTTYNSSSTAGHQDTFNTAGGVGGSTPVIVATMSMARKDDAGARSMAPVIKSGSAVTVGSTATLATGYGPIWLATTTDPNTGALWSAGSMAAANAAKPGYRVIS